MKVPHPQRDKCHQRGTARNDGQKLCPAPEKKWHQQHQQDSDWEADHGSRVTRGKKLSSKGKYHNTNQSDAEPNGAGLQYRFGFHTIKTPRHILVLIRPLCHTEKG
ncbi:hypothetical protein [Roseovarius rhodophyticola]|uniref:Uncharacterized protein n=1 Tax=Roseovarius rhodophyticola TaxID=3080827 RepID=A0ABZ2TC35_9RHOB|nr:hypothetical protein [Roseovarius sp. W115]MDV2930945.1 hypothetical protein [Roseovarius sp. W115]